MINVRIGWRLQIMFAKRRHWKFARLFRLQELGLVRAAQFLTIDLALQFHERVQQRFRPRRTTWNVNVDRNVTIDSLEHVVTLLEWTSGNRACAHRDNVFRVRHLVVEPHDLRRHFLGHGAGHDHEIGLAWRWPENFAAEPRDVVTRRCRRDHFDRATSESKLKRPDRILTSPIIKLLHRGHPNALALQLAPQLFVDLSFGHFKCQSGSDPNLSNLCPTPKPDLRSTKAETRGLR